MGEINSIIFSNFFHSTRIVVGFNSIQYSTVIGVPNLSLAPQKYTPIFYLLKLGIVLLADMHKYANLSGNLSQTVVYK